MDEFDKMGLSAEIRRKILFDNPLEFCPASATNCQ